MPRMLLRTCLIASAFCGLWAGPCVQSTLDTYIALGATGCTVGTNSFEMFSFSLQSQSGISPLIAAATDVLVTPVQLGGQNGLTFSSTKFAETSNNSVTYLLTFAEDPTGSIRSLDDALFDPVTAPGRGEVDSIGCLGGNFIGVTCSTGIANLVGPVDVFDDGSGNPVQYGALGIPAQTLLGIQDQILINGGAGGNVSSPPNEPFTIGTQFVPEPGAGCLAAAGLAALFLVRQARLKRA